MSQRSERSSKCKVTLHTAMIVGVPTCLATTSSCGSEGSGEASNALN